MEIDGTHADRLIPVFSATDEERYVYRTKEPLIPRSTYSRKDPNVFGVHQFYLESTETAEA